MPSKYRRLREAKRQRYLEGRKRDGEPHSVTSFAASSGRQDPRLLWVATRPLEADAPARGVVRAADRGLGAGPWRVIDRVRESFRQIEVPGWQLEDGAAQLPLDAQPVEVAEEPEEVD